MKVIVGLGNPGREYAATRHNVGWWLIDHLADVWHFEGWKKDGDAHVASGIVGAEKVKLVKPQTFMNLSGSALRPFLRNPFFSPAKELLVVSDEVQIPVGRFRLRSRGSAGGHNGLKSVESAIGNQEYARLRIGVGPSEERRGVYDDLSEFVLAPFARDERDDIVAVMPALVTATETWLTDGIEKAMNLHNRAPNSTDESESE
jgi:peptidyl-tRNA hydrolase, PTH1 family